MSSDIFVSFRQKLLSSFRNFNFDSSSVLPEYNYSQNKIIQDKTCPKCKKYVYGNNNEVCTCGHSFVKTRNVQLWGLVLITWALIIGTVFFTLSSFSKISSLIYSKLERTESDFYSVAPANIKIISDLKGSKYQDYIQSIYVHPKEKNKLMVLIKPVYWNMMKTDEKKTLKQIISDKWGEIYQKENPDSEFEPVVSLANFG